MKKSAKKLMDVLRTFISVISYHFAMSGYCLSQLEPHPSSLALLAAAHLSAEVTVMNQALFLVFGFYPVSRLKLHNYCTCFAQVQQFATLLRECFRFITSLVPLLSIPRGVIGSCHPTGTSEKSSISDPFRCCP